VETKEEGNKTTESAAKKAGRERERERETGGRRRGNKSPAD
jgi:hypothetical protein